MRFVHISDTHCQHARVNVPDGDCLIVSGDFCSYGSSRELITFNSWLGTLPHKHKIVVAGNHDRIFEEDSYFAKSLLTNGIYLQDSEVTIEGLRIYGSPWQPAFNGWAFNLPRGEEEIRKKWKLIPSGLDILVTHCPPYGLLDYLPSTGHLGCEELIKAILKTKPRYHLFGHIHHGYGKQKQKGTTFINSAICTEAYSPINTPQVFNIKKKK